MDETDQVIAAVKKFYLEAIDQGPAVAIGWTEVVTALAQYLVDEAVTDTSAASQNDDALARAQLFFAELNGEPSEHTIRTLAIERVASGKPLPPVLVGPVIEMLRGAPPTPAPKGPNRTTYLRRDVAICMCVLALRMQGFKTTRNPASDHDSACSLVADIANLTEDAVTKIVSKAKLASKQRSPLSEK